MLSRCTLRIARPAIAPQVWGFSGKEATKLFESAKSAKSITQVSQELASFVKAFDASYELRASFLNPLMKGEPRAKQLEALYPKLNIKSQESKQIISDLAAQRKLSKLSKILVDFAKLAQFDRNEIKAIVTSAEPLTSDQISRLTSALKTRLQQGEQLVVEQRQDPSIVGGLKVLLENKMLDLSVASRIKHFDRAIRGKA